MGQALCPATTPRPAHRATGASVVAFRSFVNTRPGTVPRRARGRAARLLVLGLLLLGLWGRTTATAGPYDADEAARLYRDALLRFQSWGAAAPRGASDADQSQWIAEGETVAGTFRQIAGLFPDHPLADDALLMTARALLVLNRHVPSQHRLQTARHVLSALVVSYPAANSTDQALYTLGYLLERYFNDPRGAIREYRKLVTSFADSSLAPFARQQMADLQPLVASAIGGSRRPTTATLATDAAAGPLLTPASAVAPLVADRRRDRLTGWAARRWAGYPMVTDIRFRSTPSYTRVVVDVTKPVKVKTGKLTGPDRIYFDILHCRVHEDLHNRSYPLGEGMLREVRLAQNAPEVCRLVLEFDHFTRYRLFPLRDPYRLVVDIFKDEAQRPATAQPTPTSVVVPDDPREARRLARVLGVGIRRIVVDAGHGGKDPGAIGPGRVREKDIVLDVAKRVAKILSTQYGFDVVMTRNKDVFVPLEERTAIANASKADLFLSIHANASKRRAATGIETYYLNLTSDPHALETAARENATSSATMSDLGDLLENLIRSSKIEESRRFATFIQDGMKASPDKRRRALRDLGVKKAPFYVLIGSEVPSALAEIGFVTNRSEARHFGDPAYRQAIAESLAKGVFGYVASLEDRASRAVPADGAK